MYGESTTNTNTSKVVLDGGACGVLKVAVEVTLTLTFTLTLLTLILTLMSLTLLTLTIITKQTLAAVTLP
jgi:hypothetical protein